MTHAGTQQLAKARARVEALFQAFNDHDADKIVAMHAADAVWEDPRLTEPATGREEISAVVGAMFRAFPDLRFVLDELEIYTAPSGRLAARWHCVATMTGPIDPPGFAPTGKTASFSGACFYQFKGTMIERHTIVYDTMGMLVQLGIMPAAGTAPAKATVAIQRALAEVGKRLPRR